MLTQRELSKRRWRLVSPRFHRSFIPAPIISSPFNVTGKNRGNGSCRNEKPYIACPRGDFDLRFAMCRAAAREFGLIAISRGRVPIPAYVSKSRDRNRSMRYSAEWKSNVLRARAAKKDHFVSEKNGHGGIGRGILAG